MSLQQSHFDSGMRDRTAELATEFQGHEQADKEARRQFLRRTAAVGVVSLSGVFLVKNVAAGQQASAPLKMKTAPSSSSATECTCSCNSCGCACGCGACSCPGSCVCNPSDNQASATTAVSEANASGVSNSVNSGTNVGEHNTIFKQNFTARAAAGGGEESVGIDGTWDFASRRGSIVR